MGLQSTSTVGSTTAQDIPSALVATSTGDVPITGNIPVIIYAGDPTDISTSTSESAVSGPSGSSRTFNIGFYTSLGVILCILSSFIVAFILRRRQKRKHTAFSKSDHLFVCDTAQINTSSINGSSVEVSVMQPRLSFLTDEHTTTHAVYGGPHPEPDQPRNTNNIPLPSLPVQRPLDSVPSLLHAPKGNDSNSPKIATGPVVHPNRVRDRRETYSTRSGSRSMLSGSTNQTDLPPYSIRRLPSYNS